MANAIVFNYGLVIVLFNTLSVSYAVINIVLNRSSETVGVVHDKRTNIPIEFEIKPKNIKSNQIQYIISVVAAVDCYKIQNRSD